jgi:hypothetical protein
MTSLQCGDRESTRNSVSKAAEATLYLAAGQPYTPQEVPIKKRLEAIDAEEDGAA